jgi:hypothetical protein
VLYLGTGYDYPDLPLGNNNEKLALPEIPAWVSLIMASQNVFIAISRICIIGLGLLDVFPIGTTTKQNKSNQVSTMVKIRTSSA